MDEDSLRNLDSELDRRLKNLCLNKKNIIEDIDDENDKTESEDKMSHSMPPRIEVTISPIINEGNKSDVPSTSKIMQEKRTIKPNIGESKESPKSEKYPQGPANYISEATTDKKEADDASKSEDKDPTEEIVDDAIFEEFLENTTKMKIKSLSGRLDAAIQALHITKDHNKQLQTELSEIRKTSTSQQREITQMEKQIQISNLALTKKEKFLKDAQRNIDELRSLNQNLNTDMKKYRNEASKATNHQASLEMRTNQANKKVQDIRHRHNEESELYRQEIRKLKLEIDQKVNVIHNLETKNKQLESLVKKEEKMISVLRTQKDNLISAKTTECMQNKYFAMLSQIQQSTQKINK